MSRPEKLVAMCTQIAGFFRTQPADPAAAIAEHLVKFWTPAMCDTLRLYVMQGGPVEPLVKEAVSRLPSRSGP